MIKFKSIKNALLFKIGLVAIFPLLAISIFNFGYFRHFSMDTTADIQSLVNQNTATRIYTYLLSQQLIFMEYAKYSGVRFENNETDEFINQRLTGFLNRFKSNSLFGHLLVVDSTGKVLAHDSAQGTDKSLLNKQFTGFPRVQTFYFSPYTTIQIDRFKLEGQFAIMPLVKSSLNNRLYLVGLTKLDIMAFFMNEEFAVLEKKNIHEGTLLLVDDKTKKEVLRVTQQKVFPAKINWDKLDADNRVIKSMDKIWYGDKEEVIIGLNKYYLATIVTKKDIAYPSSQMLRITLSIVIIALVLMGITIVLIAQGFVRPLKKIGAGLHAVARGKFDEVIDIKRDDEFGTLSTDANSMTIELKESAEKIKQQIEEIERERERAEHLLLNILPKSIADRLKEEEKTIADEFDQATILFSDLVGFTEFSSRHTAERLVFKLNDLYSRFDDLLDIYHVEKIKTIGDALMLVSGVPDRIENHAEEMAKMALHMYKTLDEFNHDNNEKLRLRIGLHTGPVVAGVIGKKKFCYDLWGDSVNTASRMESNGVPGVVQISDKTYEIIKGKFAIDHRGDIEVKGKGTMDVYILKHDEAQEWDRDYAHKKG